MSNKRKLKAGFKWVAPIIIDARPGADQVMKGMPKKGDINAYVCDTCDKLTVVIHADAGVTPMFLDCLTTENCDGQGTSLGYPAQHAVPQRIRDAAVWEWYRPGPFDKILKDKDVLDHITNGGLALRPKE